MSVAVMLRKPPWGKRARAASRCGAAEPNGSRWTKSNGADSCRSASATRRVTRAEDPERANARVGNVSRVGSTSRASSSEARAGSAATRCGDGSSAAAAARAFSSAIAAHRPERSFRTTSSGALTSASQRRPSTPEAQNASRQRMGGSPGARTAAAAARAATTRSRFTTIFGLKNPGVDPGARARLDATRHRAPPSSTTSSEESRQDASPPDRARFRPMRDGDPSG